MPQSAPYNHAALRAIQRSGVLALAAGAVGDAGEGIGHVLVAVVGDLVHEIAVMRLHGLLDAHDPLAAVDGLAAGDGIDGGVALVFLLL